MITPEFVGYALVVAALVGIVYVTMFQNGPETEEGYSPSYGKAKEDVSNTEQR